MPTKWNYFKTILFTLSTKQHSWRKVREYDEGFAPSVVDLPVSRGEFPKLIEVPSLLHGFVYLRFEFGNQKDIPFNLFTNEKVKTKKRNAEFAISGFYFIVLDLTRIVYYYELEETSSRGTHRQFQVRWLLLLQHDESV